jgi:hypothetical protein
MAEGKGRSHHSVKEPGRIRWAQRGVLGWAARRVSGLSSTAQTWRSRRDDRNLQDIFRRLDGAGFSGVYPQSRGELYTSQITPYHRAPHFFLGFPTRYEDRGLTPSTKHLPQWKVRKFRSTADPREGNAVTEGLFMASRDGRNFRVFQEAFIRPGLRTKDSWFYGDMYQNNGLVETKSSIAEDAPNELSMYLTEGTLQNGKPGKLRRYTLRLDGFVSIHATMEGGQVVTKPIRFSGKKLTLNYSSSARGGVCVGLADAVGKAISGYSLDDCPSVYGDHLDRPVEWYRGDKVTNDVSTLAGKPVKIVFELKDAVLYSYQFVDE